MKSQSFFTSTKDQFKDNSWTPESTIGLTDVSLETVPMAKAAISVTKTVGSVSKTTATSTSKAYTNIGIKTGVILDTKVIPKINSGVTSIVNNGKNSIIKVDSVYDDIGRKIYIKQQETPLIKNFGPDQINDIVNESLPPSTKIGQGVAIGVGIVEKLKELFEDTDKEDKNND